ncbi:MAG: V-type ATP synthase subunit I [Kiritimatiellia bacterium]
MIVPMQHLTLLCLQQDAAATLTELRELGLLHLTSAPAQADALAQGTEAVRQTEVAIHTLKTAHPEAKTADDPHPANLVKLVTERLQRRYAAEEQLAHCHHEKQLLEPFGDFDPDQIEDLQARGIIVKLLRVNDPETLQVPEGVVIQPISRTKKGACLVAIAREDFEIDGTISSLPERSLPEIRREAAALQTELADIHSDFKELAVYAKSLESELLHRQEELEFARAKVSLAAHGPLASLTGFCPAKKVAAVAEAAAKHGWALQSREPHPEEEVPTLLQMPRWVKPVKAVLQMLSILPGYREADISAVFLVFFSIFFAILIGDAGYGLLFLGITAFARKKLPQAPAYPFVLFTILSTTTILWGAATGNWFGIAPASLPRILQSVHLSFFQGPAARDLVIRICFLIGATHLTIAHLWNTIALAPSPKAIAQIGWVGLVWSMFFTARNMVLGQALPVFFTPMLIAAVVLILLFMTSPKDLKSEWINHAMFPLSIVNCFVDIVSYIRLFAVGLASLSVAASFNNMAMQIGWNRIWTIPVFALILLLGHGLNIILCALGILVHGVRLNTLEFSLHKNVEWKGFAYRPFARLSQE